MSYFSPQSLTFLLNNTCFRNIKIKGVQRNSVENAIWWIRNSKSYTDYQKLELTKGFEWVNKYYKDVMEKEVNHTL